MFKSGLAQANGGSIRLDFWAQNVLISRQSWHNWMVSWRIRLVAKDAALSRRRSRVRLPYAPPSTIPPLPHCVSGSPVVVARMRLNRSQLLHLRPLVSRSKCGNICGNTLGGRGSHGTVGDTSQSSQRSRAVLGRRGPTSLISAGLGASPGYFEPQSTDAGGTSALAHPRR